MLGKVAARSGRAWRPILRRVAELSSAYRSRAIGPLAIDGGKPVRNVDIFPWPSASDGGFARWQMEVGASLRRVYVGGVEGLPQPLANRFSERWAAYCHVKNALLVSHGTDALRIALAAVLEHDGLSYGGEVIVPNLSFIASATAALDRRFGVALVDVDPDTLLLDPARVEEAIVPGRTRAIMPVHLFGQPADMTRLLGLARKHGLKVIEDAAQAHGASWGGHPVGSMGDAAAFSFQSSKTLSSGEGGALVTNDELAFERAYSMHNVGRARAGGNRWEHVSLGWNCRASEYQAALLLSRLEGFEAQQAGRARNFAYLRELLGGSRALVPVAVHPNVTRHGMYMFVMRYRAQHCGGVAIDEFIRLARAEGAPVVRGFPSTIAEQPAIRALAVKHPEYVRVCPTPVADRAVRDSFYIHHEIFLGSRRDMEDVAAALWKVERHLSAGSVSRQRVSS